MRPFYPLVLFDNHIVRLVSSFRRTSMFLIHVFLMSGFLCFQFVHPMCSTWKFQFCFSRLADVASRSSLLIIFSRVQKIDQTRMKVSFSFFSVPQLFGLFLIPENSNFFDLRRLQVGQNWGKNWTKKRSPRIWSRPCGARQLGAKVRCRRAMAPGSVRHQTP